MSNEELTNIEKLNPQSRGINIIVKVVSLGETRDVTGRTGSHKVADALVGDETGCMYLTLWNEAIDQIQEENTIKITNGYVNLFRENMRLNIGRYGKFEVLEESPIQEVNTDNNLSDKRYEQERRYRPYRSQYGGRNRY